MSKNIYAKLTEIQVKLNAPKGQYNKFGNYSYRSCEDILEALKPLLNEQKLCLFISDEIVQIGERYYLKATVTLADIESDNVLTFTGFAREEESKKGMDGSQVTGASSSYARKYALNGAFNIDDNKDSDATNQHDKPSPSTDSKPENKQKGSTSQAQITRIYAIARTAGVDSKKVKADVLKAFGLSSLTELTREQYDKVCNGYEKKAAENKGK